MSGKDRKAMNEKAWRNWIEQCMTLIWEGQREEIGYYRFADAKKKVEEIVENAKTTRNYEKLDDPFFSEDMIHVGAHSEFWKQLLDRYHKFLDSKSDADFDAFYVAMKECFYEAERNVVGRLADVDLIYDKGVRRQNTKSVKSWFKIITRILEFKQANYRRDLQITLSNWKQSAKTILHSPLPEVERKRYEKMYKKEQDSLERKLEKVNKEISDAKQLKKKLTLALKNMGQTTK